MTRKTKDALKQVYNILHFPVFLVVLTFFVQYFSIFPVRWANEINYLPIKVYEKSLLEFLSRYIITNQVVNFLMIGILFLVFSLISLNRKKFITYTLGLYFFMYFFVFFIMVKLNTGLNTTLNIDLLLSIVFTVVMMIAFLIIPVMLQDKLARVRREKNLSKHSIPIVMHECKNCGEKYLSNPLYCAKCMNKLE
ncbi:MAG: hypothetical protein ACFFCS_28645 [Candidatus Hodarchaeota archaeon]